MKKMNLLLLVVLGISMLACDGDKEYRGDWALGVAFGGEPRTAAVSFVIDNIAYVGTGYGTPNAEFKNFKKFVNGSWQPAPSLPDTLDGREVKGRHGAVAFVIGDRAYVGTGYVAALVNDTTSRDLEWLDDFYKFDATTGTWSRVADFPGPKRRDAVAFAINGHGYVGTGQGENGYIYKDFYRYDPAANTWTEIPFDGEARYGAVAFVIDGAAHVCLGASGINRSMLATDHYKFVPTSNGDGTWEKMQSLVDTPENRGDTFYDRIQRRHGVAFIAGNNGGEYAHVATGSNAYTWWYDHKRDLWHEVEELPVGTQRAPNVAQAVAFSIRDASGTARGYFTTGGTTLDASPSAQTWTFIPNVKEDRGNDY
jgi:N-acetylneuraminic acid mutarotase